MSALTPQWLDEALMQARAAAAAAATVIARYPPASLAVGYKQDESPVTQADRESERAIKQVLKTAYPEHGYWGEEEGTENPEHEFLWLIDPIDGTKSFVRGHPFYSTQIALCHRGQLVLGVSSAPHYGEVAWARQDGGAYLNGARIHVSAVTQVSRAHISLGNLKTLAAGARWPHLGTLVTQADRVRGYGDFCHYHLLARGGVDAVIESDVHILDIAALVVVLREAGATCTDLDGQGIDLHTRSVLAAATPALYTGLRAIIDGPERRL